MPVSLSVRVDGGIMLHLQGRRVIGGQDREIDQRVIVLSESYAFH